MSIILDHIAMSPGLMFTKVEGCHVTEAACSLMIDQIKNGTFKAPKSFRSRSRGYLLSIPRKVVGDLACPAFDRYQTIQDMAFQDPMSLTGVEGILWIYCMTWLKPRSQSWICNKAGRSRGLARQSTISQSPCTGPHQHVYCLSDKWFLKLMVSEV